jgi:putative hydrolase of the HAD superfamily
MIHALIFDWGNTLMRVFPKYKGPMAFWPKVEAVAGVKEILLLLQPRYRLVLATNATDSDAILVRKALSKVSLEEHFYTVLTSQELGIRKPDPAFYQAVLKEVGYSPHQTAMIGDNYEDDIASAKQSGLWTIWFNPKGIPSPFTNPLHDAEIKVMAKLPSALENLNFKIWQI